MRCREVRELMGAYLYGDLSPDEMREVRLHAHECVDCREDIETRGQVLASVENEPPVLGDEERQRIAWSVKGAIRNSPVLRPAFRLKLAPALGVAVVLVAGVAVGSLMKSHSASPPAVSQSAQKKEEKGKPSPVVVKIREEDNPSAAKDRANSASDAGSAAADARSADFVKMTEAVGDAVAEAIRKGSLVGTSSRQAAAGKRDKMVQPDEPVSVADPESGDGKAESGNIKLPEPTDLNDATTTPPTPNQNQ